MVCNLCFSPCNELGRLKWAELAGEFGVLELGELLLDDVSPVDRALSDAGDHILLSGGDFGDLVGEPGKESPDDRERLREVKLRLGVIGEPRCCSALLLLSLLNREVRLFLSSLLPRWCFFLDGLRAIFTEKV